MGKVRKEPKRTCVGCRQITNKIDLIRIVRTKGKDVIIDHSYRTHGRGAYIHPSTECLEAALRIKAFQRSLKVDFDGEIVENIKREVEKIIY